MLAPTRVQNAPKSVFIIFSLLSVPMLYMAASVGNQAVLDWRKIETQAEVIETRVVQREVRSGRSRGSWCKEWLVQYAGEQQHWFCVQRFYTEKEALSSSTPDVGQRRTVWYDPRDPEMVVDRSPDLWYGILGTCWLTFMGVFGLLCWVPRVCKWVKIVLQR